MAQFTKETPTAFQNLTEEQRSEMGKIGNAAMQVAKRQKKDFRESMLAALSEMIDRKNDNGDVIAKISAQDAICLKQIAKALKGDTTAAKFCVEVSAEKQKATMLGGFKFVVEPGDNEI